MAGVNSNKANHQQLALRRHELFRLELRETNRRIKALKGI
jgi:hypothetical protein